jgi:hypothetical protein
MDMTDVMIHVNGSHTPTPGAAPSMTDELLQLQATQEVYRQLDPQPLNTLGTPRPVHSYGDPIPVATHTKQHEDPILANFMAALEEVAQRSKPPIWYYAAWALAAILLCVLLVLAIVTIVKLPNAGNQISSIMNTADDTTTRLSQSALSSSQSIQDFMNRVNLYGIDVRLTVPNPAAGTPLLTPGPSKVTDNPIHIDVPLPRGSGGDGSANCTNSTATHLGA